MIAVDVEYVYDCYSGSGNHKLWGVWRKYIRGGGEPELIVVCAYKIGATKLCELLNEYERRAQ